MSVTIRDVAKAAGVSVATVSHVINRTRFVAEATQQRVLDAITQLGYRPNIAARNLKTGHNRVVAFIVPEISSYYFSTMIQAVEEFLSSRGYSLLLANTREDPELELRQAKLLSSGMADGCIIASTLESYHPYRAHLPAGLPAVFVDRAIADCPCDTVLLSDRSAIYSGTEALIRAGHRRIGCIVGLERLATTRERLEAYKSALRDHGLPVNESLIQPSMAQDTLSGVQALLDKQCTAFVISNSTTTSDTLLCLQKNEARLQTRPSILGYRSSELLPLSPLEIGSISVPAREIGLSAAELLINRIKQPDAPVRQLVLSSHLTLVQDL